MKYYVDTTTNKLYRVHSETEIYSYNIEYEEWIYCGFSQDLESRQLYYGFDRSRLRAITEEETFAYIL